MGRNTVNTILPVPLSLMLEQPAVGLAWISAILVALGIHEFSHAYVGTRLGDRTAEEAGRLTLNPFAHVDVLGLMMLLLVGFGWGKPVPFDQNQLKYRTWGPAMVALAGPAMNLIACVVAGALLVLLDRTTALAANNLLVLFLAFAFQVNLVLMLFNLIPIPPLDGSKLLLAVLDRPRYVRVRYVLMTRGPLILLGIVVLDGFLGGAILGRAFRVVTAWVIGWF